MQDEAKEKLDFMYDVLSKKIERQDTDFNGIVTKGSFLFAFVSTFFAAYIAVVFDGKFNLWWNIPCFLLTLYTLHTINQVLKIKEYKDPPPVDEFYTPETLAMGVNELKNTTVSTLIKAYGLNKDKIGDMADSFNKALLLLFITFATVIVLNTLAYATQIGSTTTNTNTAATTTPTSAAVSNAPTSSIDGKH